MQTCVLFVDDEPLILSLYEALSSDLGPNFTVRTARDGIEALRVMDETDVQIVVSDLAAIVPEPDMEMGDLVYAENIGAYSAASSTFFNGFPPAKVVHMNQ